ncbi:MAG: TRAM domain-containing protein, partial [Verrucomicrobiia bacterium]
MKLGEEVEVRIEDVAFGGDGVGRVNGMVVFAPFTAVGDRVTVKVIKTGKRFVRGLPMGCAEEGPGRVVPECPYYGACGGCQYQHVDYPTELAAKTKQLRDVLERIGGVGEVRLGPVVASPEVYGYRNRITVHRQEGRLGFWAIDGKTVVDVERCALASEAVNER